MVLPTKVNFGLGFYPFQLYRRRPAEVATDCKGCKIEVRWGLNVVEGCSGAWPNLRPQFIHVVDNVARDGFILFVTRADAEDGSRTGLLFVVFVVQNHVLYCLRFRSMRYRRSLVSRWLEAIVVALQCILSKCMR